MSNFEVGTIVVVRGEACKGVVVPDFMKMCGPGSVMVELDDSGSTRSCQIPELESLGMIQVDFDSEKCIKCAYANGVNCHRYTSARYGWMLARRSDRKLPKGKYPLCKEE